MTTRDAATLREQIRQRPKRWRAICDKKKDNFVAGLDEAQTAMRHLLQASNEGDSALRAAATIANIVRTAVAIEGQEQVDYWNEDKNKRLDEGKNTESFAFMPAKVNQLPLPPSLMDESQ